MVIWVRVQDKCGSIPGLRRITMVVLCFVAGDVRWVWGGMNRMLSCTMEQIGSCFICCMLMVLFCCHKWEKRGKTKEIPICSNIALVLAYCDPPVHLYTPHWFSFISLRYVLFGFLLISFFYMVTHHITVSITFKNYTIHNIISFK